MVKQQPASTFIPAPSAPLPKVPGGVAEPERKENTARSTRKLIDTISLFDYEPSRGSGHGR